MAACAYPAVRSGAVQLRTTSARPLGSSFQDASGFSNPTSSGWIETGDFTASSGHVFRSLSAKWLVPGYPTSHYSGSDTVLYLFPGFQPSDNSYIIQPVLQYGANGYWGGDYWVMASWICGSTCYHTDPVEVALGDTLYGAVTSSGCSSGLCNFTVRTWDISAGDSTQALEEYNAPDSLTWALGGTLETYNLTSCSQYMGGGVKFFDIAVADNYGNVSSPSWGKILYSTTPSCGFDVLHTATTVTVLDSLAPLPPLTVGLYGPTSVGSEGGTWSVETGPSGAPPYTYSWSGILSGTNSSVSGTPSSSGTLYLDVYDSNGTHASASLYVTRCTQCTGPGRP